MAAVTEVQFTAALDNLPDAFGPYTLKDAWPMVDPEDTDPIDVVSGSGAEAAYTYLELTDPDLDLGKVAFKNETQALLDDNYTGAGFNAGEAEDFPSTYHPSLSVPVVLTAGRVIYVLFESLKYESALPLQSDVFNSKVAEIIAILSNIDSDISGMTPPYDVKDYNTIIEGLLEIKEIGGFI